MATPNPRSYIEILSEMLATFKSRAKIQTLKVGNPILTILEAAAQSDARNVQDYFSFLESISVDFASPDALEQLIKSEGSQRLGARNSSGFVTFYDESITKQSTLVYQNNASAGATSLQVADASSFPNSGSVYIGRGTANYEGPIAYSSKTNAGAYWSLTLSTALVNFHDSSESVVLAQNGVRQIPTNTVVEVSNGLDSVKFVTVTASYMDDGEDTLDGIEVVCQTPGSKGNVAANSINKVVSSVFPSISVTNQFAFTNGSDIETIPQLRERIKKIRQTKTKGTASALELYSLGVSSSDNKTVVSSKVYDINNKATLYIDDGVGYEETFKGASNEILVKSALGGEQYFNLAERPLSQAFLRSSFSAPFNLKGSPVLSVSVDGETTEHTFSDSDFKNPFGASVYEIAASINKNSSLLFLAKTSANRIYIFGKNNENTIKCNDISSNNANDVFGFPIYDVYTLRLFKNGVLLNQDGKEAVVYTGLQNDWGVISSGATLQLSIDNAQTQTYTFVNADFVNAGTIYSLVSKNNSLDSWAKVINYKIPGINATVLGTQIQIKSNKGLSSSASISIVGGTLADGKFLSVQTSEGAGSDYELNKNFSQVKLSQALVTGDELIVSSPDARAFVESNVISVSGFTIPAGGFSFYVFEDSNAINIPAPAVSGTLTLTTSAHFAGSTQCLYLSTNTDFTNLQAGDWIIATGQTFATIDAYAMKVSSRSSSAFVTFRTTGTAGTGIFTTWSITRSSVAPQVVTIPAGTYTSNTFANYINSNYPSFIATVTNTNTVKLSNRDVKSGRGIYIAGTQGSGISFPVKVLVTNSQPEAASVESGNSQVGFPFLSTRPIAGGTFATPLIYTGTAPNSLSYRISDLIQAKNIKNFPLSPPPTTNSPATDTVWAISSVNESTGAFGAYSLNNPVPQDRTISTNVFPVSPFTFSADDSLSVSVNKTSESSLNFEVPFFVTAKVKTGVGATYGTSLFDVTKEDGVTSLKQDLGVLPNDFFTNFTALMRARGKSHSTTPNKTILFRYGDYGPQGEGVRVRFSNPTAPNNALRFSTSKTPDYLTYNIHLPSGAALTPTTLLGDMLCVETAKHIHSIPVGNITRTGGNTVTVTCGPAGVLSHNFLNGDTIFQQTSISNFAAGPKVITGTTLNTFTYTETGSNTTSLTATSYFKSAVPAGTTFNISAISYANYRLTVTTTSAHNFKVGQKVSLSPSHSQTGASFSEGNYRVTAVISSTQVELYWPSVALTSPISLVAGVTYTLSEGASDPYTISFVNPTSVSGNTTRDASGNVTVNFDYNSLFTGHPFVVGDVVYVSGGGGTIFTAGFKTIISTTSNSITFYEGGGVATSTASVTVSFNSTTNPNFGAIVANNIVSLKDISQNTVAKRISSISSTALRTSFDLEDYLTTTSTSNSSLKKVSEKSLTFYSMAISATAATVVSWVNTNMKDSLGNQLLSAVLVPDNSTATNNGSQVISLATEDEFFARTTNASNDGSGSRSVAAFPLFDGYQSILANNITNTNSQIQFKTRPFSGELTAKNDFDNEIFKIVPTTNINVSNLLNCKGLSGLSNSAVAYPSGLNKIQIQHLLAGADFNIQVNGGTANSSTATTVSAMEPSFNGNILFISRLLNTYIVKAKTSDLSGFVGNSWVSIQNPTAQVKTNTYLSNNFSSNVILTTVGTETKVTFFDSPIFYRSVTLTSSKIFRFENHKGCFSLQDQDSGTNYSSFRGFGPGDYLYLNFPNSSNKGLYKIVGIDFLTNTFFLEGSCVAETVLTDATTTLNVVSCETPLIGETITIKNDMWGPLNNGTYTISGFELDGSNLMTGAFYLSSVLQTGTYSSSPSNISLKQSAPTKTYALIDAIQKNSDDTSTILLSSNSVIGYDYTNSPSIGASSQITTGATITLLDKLQFDTSLVSGIDGYAYNTGLLSEVNKVIFGDEKNSLFYPGVAAAGTDLSIRGPIIKRVSVSLAIRSNQTNQNDLIIKVKNAVASLINSLGVGEPIVLSDIIDAANNIDGVQSVVMISPQLNSGTDIIQTQPFEKAKILDIDSDISVSILV